MLIQFCHFKIGCFLVSSTISVRAYSVVSSIVSLQMSKFYA